jgi:hypothetical protein
VLTGIFFPILIILILIKNWAQNKKEFGSEKVTGINYFFSDFGVTTTYKTEKNISWNNVSKVKENRNILIIYPNEDSLLLIPKKFFKGSERIKVLKNF